MQQWDVSNNTGKPEHINHQNCTDKDNSPQERNNGTLPAPNQQDQNMKTRRTTEGNNTT
jgi:hypothetical protein